MINTFIFRFDRMPVAWKGWRRCQSRL